MRMEIPEEEEDLDATLFSAADEDDEPFFIDDEDSSQPDAYPPLAKNEEAGEPNFVHYERIDPQAGTEK